MMTKGPCSSQHFSNIICEDLRHLEMQNMSLSGYKKFKDSMLEIGFPFTLSYLREGKGSGKLPWLGHA